MASIQHFFRNLSKQKNFFLKPIIFNVYTNRNLNYAAKEYTHESNPAPIFFNEETQNVLKYLTRIDLKKVYRKRKLGTKKPEQPVYKFMTDEQLQEAMNEAKKQLDDLLQMPPVIPVRKPINKILAEEPALEGLETSRLIITDITFGVKNSERLVVVREPNGTLRHADWDTKDRVNQIYFPIAGRKLRTPHMFKDYYLENLLNKKEYTFILDRTCLQFEPDSTEYQRITSITYQCVDKNNDFGVLRSTRHFGPLAFFLVWFRSIDNLLLDLIETAHVDEGATLIKLYAKIHKIDINGENLELIENYISKHSTKKGQLELVLQAYKEAEEQRKILEKGIKEAHGIV